MFQQLLSRTWGLSHILCRIYTDIKVLEILDDNYKMSDSHDVGQCILTLVGTGEEVAIPQISNSFLQRNLYTPPLQHGFHENMSYKFLEC